MLALFGFVTLAALLFAGRSVLAAVSLHMAADRALRARKLDLKEREIAIQEARIKGPSVPKSIPSDLVRRIRRWETPDAQEAERANILDLYHQFHDAPDPWVEVRNHLPPEPSAELPQEMFTGMLQS